MGGDKAFEIGAESAEAGFAVEGFTHAEASDDDVGIMIGESGFFGWETSGTIACGEDVAGPAEIANREIGALAEESFEIAVNAQLVGKGVSYDGNAVA